MSPPGSPTLKDLQRIRQELTRKIRNVRLFCSAPDTRTEFQTGQAALICIEELIEVAQAMEPS